MCLVQICNSERLSILNSKMILHGQKAMHNVKLHTMNVKAEFFFTETTADKCIYLVEDDIN